MYLKLFLLSIFLGTTAFASSNEDHPLPDATGSFARKAITLDNGIELEYVEQGSKGGIPVLMLHGLPDSWRSFEEVLPFLPADMHVFSITQRGHGNSSKPSGKYEPNDFSNDIANFMKAKGLSSAILVGHSMGGTTVQSFAVNHPEMARGIVLIGSFANYNHPELIKFRNELYNLTDPIDSSYIAEFQISTLSKPIQPTQLATYINESLKVPAFVIKNVAIGWDHADFIQGLKSYNNPALLVWGSKDNISTMADQEALRSAMKNSQLIVYPETGHGVHWEEPEKFASDLVKFAHSIEKN